jgi:hypothetical protein
MQALLHCRDNLTLALVTTAWRRDAARMERGFCALKALTPANELWPSAEAATRTVLGAEGLTKACRGQWSCQGAARRACSRRPEGQAPRRTLAWAAPAMEAWTRDAMAAIVFEIRFGVRVGKGGVSGRAARKVCMRAACERVRLAQG